MVDVQEAIKFVKETEDRIREIELDNARNEQLKITIQNNITNLEKELEQLGYTKDNVEEGLKNLENTLCNLEEEIRQGFN